MCIFILQYILLLCSILNYSVEKFTLYKVSAILNGYYKNAQEKENGTQLVYIHQVLKN